MVTARLGPDPNGARAACPECGPPRSPRRVVLLVLALTAVAVLAWALTRPPADAVASPVAKAVANASANSSPSAASTASTASSGRMLLAGVAIALLVLVLLAGFRHEHREYRGRDRSNSEAELAELRHAMSAWERPSYEERRFGDRVVMSRYGEPDRPPAGLVVVAVLAVVLLVAVMRR